jgi:hypothetical protein
MEPLRQAARLDATYQQQMITCDTYENQARSWPRQGRHILAHYDDDSIHVYQAYRPAIASWAVENQRFGGESAIPA